MRRVTETEYMIDSTEFDTEFDGDRYNDGWAKKITGLDRTKSNGYSILGDFVQNSKTGTYRVTEGCLYLDCDIQGSRKNNNSEYTLFTIFRGEIKILNTYQNYRNENRSWAVELWGAIDAFFAQPETDDSPLAHISTDDLLAELAKRERKINTEIRRRIMTRAWELYKAEKYETFSEALSASWAEKK